MGKTFKRILASVLTAVMLLTAAPLSGFVGLKLNLDWFNLNTKAGAATYSGTCGDNLKWTLDDGELVISGLGMMWDYSSSSIPWRDYKVQIKTVRILDGVRTIGDFAFYTCYNIIQIEIPNSVISIGINAFCGCSSLENIEVPNSVKCIGGAAFSNCESLVSITLPNSIETIDDWMFRGCKSLIDITIPNTVTSICDLAFEYCESLTSIIVPVGVTRIGNGAFENCKELTHIKIPDTVTSIGAHAFYGCGSLASITIPDSVTRINDNTFYNCSSLTSITISDSVTYIGESAFLRCSGLTNIIIPNSVTRISDNAFYDCDSLERVTIGNGVTCIGEKAFYDCDSLESIIIPDSVISILDNSFDDCGKLTSVTIGKGVTSIKSAFNVCSSLKIITVDDANSEYSSNEYGVLFNKDKTKLIQYPIGNERTNYKVPDGVTSIDDGAFCDCENLTTVTISDSIIRIGLSAFKNCKKLTNVTIGNGVSSIGDNAFCGCAGLTSVTIPDSVIYIGDAAFNSCVNLTSMTIGNSVTNIGGAAFAGCTSLTSVLIPDSVTNLEFNAFAGCTGLTTVTIGNGVTFINSGVFDGCENLTSITMFDSVTSVGGEAFYHSGLECVHYSGTQNQWNAIKIEDGNSTLKNAELHLCEKKAGLPATCETEGYTEGLYCVECDKYVVEHEIIPVTAHIYRVDETPATCTTAGKKVYTCDCGDTYTEKIPALGHNPEYFKVEPTCKEEGYECYKCTLCGTEYAHETIPVTDHSYAEVILNAPTCEEEGIMRYTCSFCGDCYDAPIAATGHTLTKIRKEPTCTAIGSEQYLCELCGNLIGDMVILPKSDHTYGEWNASVEPTATKDGYGERTCSVCGANEMTTIPKFAQKCIVDGNMIYGIAAGLDIETFNNEYFVVSVATSQTTASSENKIGTGSYVTITDSNGTVISYDIFLFGDVNGDGWYDGMDAVTVSCIANGLLTKDQIGEAAYMAADCNHDGVVDEFDVAILNQAGVLLANVDQTKTHEELAVDSDYVEYLNLIDQNPTIEEEPEQTPEPQKTYESILEMIIDFIKTVFDFLISIFQK